MADAPLERVNYFTGEALLTDDFETEQDYQLRKLRYHNRTLHTWGIAWGLEVRWNEEGQDLTVTEGVAIDSLGREIVLVEERSLSTLDLGPAVYYLTITYAQMPTVFTEETGAKGYKRILERPEVELRESDADPGIHLLLAIVDLGAPAELTRLFFDDGESQRRHAGIRLGKAEFPLAGDEGFEASIAGRRDVATGESWLQITSPETRFGSQVRVPRGDLGIGVFATDATLEVQAIRFQGGKRTISSRDDVVTLDEGVFLPPLVRGDRLSAAPQTGASAETRVVTKVLSESSAEVDQPYDPPLDQAVFWWEHGWVEKVCDASGAPILAVTAGGRVGIGTDTPAVALQVEGTIEADSFIGDGSQLTNTNGLWSRSPTDAEKIYYDEGNVGIGTDDPPASLTVLGGQRQEGIGILSNLSGSKAVVGDDGAAFQSQIAPGDILVVGTYPGDKEAGIPLQKRLVAKLTDDTHLETESPFDPPLTDAKFEVIGSIARLTYEDADAPSMVVKPERVGINLEQPEYTLDVNGDIHADKLVVNGVEIDGDLDVKGNLDVAGTITSGQGLSVGGALDVEGAATLRSSLDVAGTSSLAEVDCGSLRAGSGASGIDATLAVVGSVAVIGDIQQLPAYTGSPWSKSSSDDQTHYRYSNSAPTDGLVLGFTNSYQSGKDVGDRCLGWIWGASGGAIAGATGCNNVYYRDGKDFSYSSMMQSFVFPVSKGAAFSLAVDIPDDNHYDPTISFYWIPFGQGSLSDAETTGLSLDELREELISSPQAASRSFSPSEPPAEEIRNLIATVSRSLGVSLEKEAEEELFEALGRLFLTSAS